MSYPESIRNWWTRVADNKCQQEFYTEERGWQECGRPIEEVHHIEAERFTLDNLGREADGNIALPLCKAHHASEGGEEHSRLFSYHPDIGQARARYKDWRTNRDRLEVKLEKRVGRDVYPSPFDEAVEDHKRKSAKGERYWAGSKEIDRYYQEKMASKGVIYQAEHPDDKFPDCKRKYRRHKPKPHWSDGLFDP